jgi:hypothetical protein
MTAPQPTPWQVADYVSGMVMASLEAGGPLYRALSDLLSEAEGVAFRAAGIEGDDPGAEWPQEREDVLSAIVAEIASKMFDGALAYRKSKEGAAA